MNQISHDINTKIQSKIRIINTGEKTNLDED